MFGNRLGWGISAGIILITAFLLYWVHSIGTNFSPPGFVGKNAAAWTMQLPTQPRPLATWMTEQRSAADSYRQMIAEYQNDFITYDDYKGELQGPVHDRVKKGVDLLLAGRTASQGGVFAGRPEAIINYDTDKAELKAIAGIRTAALKMAAQYVNTKKVPKAREIYEALFTLGVKLYEERYVFEEWHQGRECLAASIGLARISTDPAEIEKYKAFDQQFPDFYNGFIKPVQKQIFIANPSPERFPEHEGWGGDLAALATKGGDIMWKIEAIFALGRCKFNGVTPGDIIGAKRLINQIANGDDKYLKIAASHARDLTLEGFHKLTATSD